MPGVACPAAHADLLAIDIEDVGQLLIEDNIVAVSRQMIDKEASLPGAGAAKANGHANGSSMDVDN